MGGEEKTILMRMTVQCLDTNAFGEGAVLGCDFVGTVESKGEVTKDLDQGDLIAGLIWGGKSFGSCTNCSTVN